MKVWLDDLRDAPVGWVRCFWPDEVVRLLETEHVDEISLDHDLGDDLRGTGYDVLAWLEEKVFLDEIEPPNRISVHSSNPSAANRMYVAIESIFNLKRSRR